MVTWNEQQLREYQDRHQRTAPKLERDSSHEQLATSQAPPPHPRCHKVFVVSRRIRLIDPDNLCAKYHIDGLRYCGAIKDDTAKHITLSVSQEKVKTKAEECTVISIV